MDVADAAGWLGGLPELFCDCCKAAAAAWTVPGALMATSQTKKRNLNLNFIQNPDINYYN